MEKLQILHEIVSADQKAREIHNEVQKLKDGYQEDLEQQIEWMSINYYSKADLAIQKHEHQEVKSADASIAQIDRELEASMARARAFMDENSTQLARMLFDKVVGRDD